MRNYNFRNLAIEIDWLRSIRFRAFLYRVMDTDNRATAEKQLDKRQNNGPRNDIKKESEIDF